MRRCISLFLAAWILLALCGCQTAPTPEVSVPTETALPTDTPTPTALPQGETTSMQSASIMIDKEGVIWTSLAPMEGTSYVYDILPEDAGHVCSFLVCGSVIYAALKENYFSMDDLRIIAFSTDTGETTVLADDALGNSTFCLLGEDWLLYMSGEGLCTIHLPTGEVSAPLTGTVNLLAARNGTFYYTKDDGGLYRNNSSLAAEEKLLDLCPSYWFCPGENSLCTLAYTEEGTAAVVEFRSPDGTLLSRQPLSTLPIGICSDGTEIYVPQDTENAIQVYDFSTRSLSRTISLPEGTASCLPLLTVNDTLYYQALVDGSFRIFRLDPDDSEPVELATDILV